MYMPFTPKFGATKNIAATATSARVALGGELYDQVEVSNDGPDPVFVAFGSVTITAATTTSYPVLAGQSKMVTIGKASYAAAITLSGETATVYFTPGRGQ